MSEEPLVTVLTPVYNGESFLEECIESVLRQTYRNYEYIIVNNCSKDRTPEIASQYAKRDSRIRVHNNNDFVGVIENHNIDFRLITAESKYCKVVSADDWLFPECIKRMVELAETHPSAGIVGSYQLSGGGGKWYVRTDGLPYHTSLISGREICRAHLLSSMDVFGNPTSNLYRCDLMRSTDCFYPNSTAEADISACFKNLRYTDFGFVHQVLSCERLHEIRQTSTSTNLNAYLSSQIGDLLAYGTFYLTTDEADRCLKDLMDEYYAFLAISAVNFRGKEFWRYHKRRLEELGHPLSGLRLGKAVSLKLMDLLLNPKRTVEALLKRVHNRRT